MGSSTEASVLDALEQAELAARERRLAASSQAEAILSAAEQRASAISAGASRRVDEALDELRRSADAEADAAIEGLERAAGQRSNKGAAPASADAAFEQAVTIVVAHVLGEVSPQPVDEEGV